jgi:hypothetical protein
MVTQPTRGKRGRPTGTTKPLREDHERLIVAYFIARMTLGNRWPEPVKVARFLMQSHYAQIDDPREFADAIDKDRFLPLDMQPSKRMSSGRNNPEEEYWYDQNAANALAHNFTIKVRKLSKKLHLVVPSDAEGATSDQKDAYWLDLMVEAWRLALHVEAWWFARTVETWGDDFWARSEKVRAALCDVARDFAGRAGELAYFEKMIEPKFGSQFAKTA